MSQTQNSAILEFLQKGCTLTPLEALEMFGCFRLAARIRDLREQGHDIQSEIVPRHESGKTFCRYSMPNRRKNG